MDKIWKFEWTRSKSFNFNKWVWFFYQKLTKVTKFHIFMKWQKKRVECSCNTYFSFWHIGCKTNWTGHLTYYVRVMDSIWKKVCICPDNDQYMVRSEQHETPRLTKTGNTFTRYPRQYTKTLKTLWAQINLPGTSSNYAETPGKPDPKSQWTCMSKAAHQRPQTGRQRWFGKTAGHTSPP